MGGTLSRPGCASADRAPTSVIDSAAVSRDGAHHRDSSDSPPGSARTSATGLARALHRRAARGETGVLLIVVGDEAPRRLDLREGEVHGIDAGSDAPATPGAQLRYLLRLRGRPEFLPGETLSVRYSVPPFRPDVSIRQHIDAQQIPHDALRRSLGNEPIAVVLPPHGSSLHSEEQAIVSYLAMVRSVPDLLSEGARSQLWSPLRALRLLVVLDALGSLVVGGESGAIAEALLLLNLPAAATLDEIKQTYRRLAHAHHPDRHAQADASTQRAHSARFAELTAAYRLLQKGRR